MPSIVILLQKDCDWTTLKTRIPNLQANFFEICYLC